VIQAFGQQIDVVKDWEWRDEGPEIVEEVLWSEDEHVIAQVREQGKGEENGRVEGGEMTKRDDSGGGAGGGISRIESSEDGEDEMAKVNGATGGTGGIFASEKDSDTKPKEVALKGKSWMVVTNRLMQGYYNKLAA